MTPNITKEMKIVQPTSKHTHTIINLHARDNSGEEYHDEFLESQASDKRTLFQKFPGFKWVFPDAPLTTSKRFDMDMQQWFDMWKTESPRERSEDQLEDLRRIIAAIKQLVLKEADVIGLENIILAGISQGAATALSTLFDMNIRICGFIGFSTWLPEHCATNGSQALQTPMFLAHCQNDEVIDIKYGEAAMKRLNAITTREVTWHSYVEGPKEYQGH